MLILNVIKDKNFIQKLKNKIIIRNKIIKIQISLISMIHKLINYNNN